MAKKFVDEWGIWHEGLIVNKAISSNQYTCIMSQGDLTHGYTRIRKHMAAIVAKDSESAARGENVLADGLSRRVVAAGKAQFISAAPAVLKTWHEQPGKRHLSNKTKAKVIASLTFSEKPRSLS